MLAVRIEHAQESVLFFTGRPADYREPQFVYGGDRGRAQWPAVAAATGLTETGIADLLAAQADSLRRLAHHLHTPAGLRAWLADQPADAALGTPQTRQATPTVTASYLPARGIAPVVTTRPDGCGNLLVRVERPLPGRLWARSVVTAPLWAAALEWTLAETVAPFSRLTPAETLVALDRACAWEAQVRAVPARPGGYRAQAERIDPWYTRVLARSATWTPARSG